MDTTILSKLQDLERYVQQLRKFQNYSYNEIESDLEKMWAIEHGLQVSIQIVIDIGNHILASIGENQIEDYTGILDKLGQRGLRSKPVLTISFHLSLRRRFGEWRRFGIS